MICNRLRYPPILLLVLLLLISLSGTTAGQSDHYIIIEEVPSFSEKIDPSLREAITTEERVEVLVKLTSQVNTARVAREAARGISPGRRRRDAAGTAVTKQLQEHAAAAQKGVIQYLQQEQRRGNVREYQGYYIVNMLFVKAIPAVVEQLARRSDVKIILPNSEIPLNPSEVVESATAVPQGVEWGVARVNAPALWDLDILGQGVVVGIIDSGADWQHEALKTKWRGFNPGNPAGPNVDYNWFDANTLPSALPSDVNGHGTHVTGIILGSSGSHQIGVAPGAQWIAARVFSNKGIATSRRILDAAQFMLAPTDSGGENPRPDLAPHIINCSWSSETPGEMNEWFRDTVQAWRNAGILPVFAAGNDGEEGAGSISNPANYPECLAVAATDSSNNLAAFSSRGPGYLEGIKPEISAPGVSIRSSLTGGSYGYKSGTSMAAPHVSGVAALLLSADEGVDIDELQQILIDTAIPLTDAGYPEWPNYGFGYGLVDALAALNYDRLLTGDLDDNGVINVVDAVQLLRYVASLLQLSPRQIRAADANSDGRINAADAIAVLRHVAGLEALSPL